MNAPISRFTGRPLPMSTIAAAKAAAATPETAQPTPQLPPGLSTIIRASARDRWITPLASTYTPAKVEQVLRGALAGNLTDQWTLFDLMEDTWPRLSKNLNKLKRAVKSRMRNFKPWVEEDEAPTPEAIKRAKVASNALWKMRPRRDENQNGFDDTIYEILDAWGKGIAVLEVDWEVRAAGKLGLITAPQATRYIHPRFYGYPNQADWLGLNVQEIQQARTSGAALNSQPSTLNLAVAPEGGGTYARFPQDKFLICVCKAKSGHPSGTALLRSLAFSWAASQFSQQWFLNFAQIFGLPIRWANYDPNTPGLLEKVLEMLENMGSAAFAAFPAGTTLELKEPMKAGTDNPQIAVLDRADHICDILILGQSGTTQIAAPGQSGGSNAANQVLEGVEEDIVEAACDFVESVLNEQMLPAINRLNFNDDLDCPECCLEEETEEDAKANADIFKVAQEIGVAIPEKFAHKKLQIPLAAEGEATLKPKAVAPPGLGIPGLPANAKAACGCTLHAHGKASPENVKLVDNTLEQLTGVSARWLAPLKPVFHELIAKAQDSSVSDADLIAAMAKARDQMPELFDKLDADALAELIYNSGSAAVVNGAIKGALSRGKPQMAGGAA